MMMVGSLLGVSSTVEAQTAKVSAPMELTEASVTSEGFDAYDIEPPVLPDVFAEA